MEWEKKVTIIKNLATEKMSKAAIEVWQICLTIWRNTKGIQVRYLMENLTSNDKGIINWSGQAPIHIDY